MTLEDLENAVLLQLQESNVAFGTQPVFAAGANYAQTTLDWAINRAYAKLLDDLADISLITETLKFPSANGVFSYPVPVPATASASLTTRAGTTALTGVILTATINGTAVTYTCTSTDGALSAITALAGKVNQNATLVTGANPVITAMQQNLDAPSTFDVAAFVNGTAGNAITLTASSSNATAISITASSATLLGGTVASPNIRTIRSVSYQPIGLTYNLYRAPGVRLISWHEYQRRTVDGYLQYFSAGQQPDYIALNTSRTRLHMFPTPFNNGDTITVLYAPQLTSTAGVPATNWGYLVNPTDAPPSMLPEDAQDCIWMYACFLLWPKAREIGTAQLYLKMYTDKMREVIANYLPATQGDAIGIRDRGDLVAGSYGWFT